MNDALTIPNLENPLTYDEAIVALSFLKSCTIAFSIGSVIDPANMSRPLHPFHYDLLKACGARMDNLVRGDE